MEVFTVNYTTNLPNKFTSESITKAEGNNSNQKSKKIVIAVAKECRKLGHPYNQYNKDCSCGYCKVATKKLEQVDSNNSKLEDKPNVHISELKDWVKKHGYEVHISELKDWVQKNRCEECEVQIDLLQGFVENSYKNFVDNVNFLNEATQFRITTQVRLEWHGALIIGLI